MPKKRTIKVRPREQRARILAEAKAKGLTAEQVEKRYGVSRWTYYGWKRQAGMSYGPLQARYVKGPTADMVRAEVRAVLPGILREEIARALGTMFGKRVR
jgi:transposase-like protein